MTKLLLLAALLLPASLHAQAFGSSNANRLRGRYLSTCTLADGQVYAWSDAQQQFICAPGTGGTTGPAGPTGPTGPTGPVGPTPFKVAQDYNFTPQAPGGALTGAVGATVTLTPCPVGVAGSDTAHRLYISAGTGTAEAVLLTGGTCTSGAASGTVSFTPANSHSGAWTVASATGGLAEARQDILNGTGIGTITINQAITMYAGLTASSSAERILFQGQGSLAVLVTRASSFTSGDMFRNSVGAVWDFRDLAITSLASTGAAIYIGPGQTSIDHVTIFNGQYGIRLVGAVSSSINDAWYVNTDMSVQAIAGLSLESLCINILISNSYFVGSPTTNANVLLRGMSILSADGVQVSDTILSGDTALLISPVGNYIANVRFLSVFIDQYRNFGVAISGAGQPISNIRFSGGHIHGQSNGTTTGLGPAVYVDPTVSGTLDELSFSGMFIGASAVEGIQLLATGMKTFSVTGSTISDNNRSNTASLAGVKFATGVTGVVMTGNTIGNTLGSGHQKYAISSVGTLDAVIASNNLLTNETKPINLGGAMTGVLADNRGLNDGVTFANLPANAPNGTVIYGTDANSTCAGGGSAGNFCLRQAGVWTGGSGGGGGGSSSVFTGSTSPTSSFSATPTFSLADIAVKSPVRFEPGAMTANVTAVTFTNKTAGAKFSIVWTQDGTGSRTVVYGSASNTCAVNPGANVSTTQQLEVAADGTTVNGVGCSDNAATATVCLPGSTSGLMCIQAPATSGGTVTGPTGTTTLVGHDTTQTLTNKTIDSAGTGNHIKVSGTDVTALSGTGGVLCTTVGSACATGGAFTPSQFYVYDEFVNFSTAVGAGKLAGQLGWVTYGSAGNILSTQNGSGYPGLVALLTGATNNDTAGIALDGSLNSSAGITTFNTGTWHMQWIVSINNTATVSHEMGLADGQGYRNANSITFRSDTTAQACTTGSNSTSHWMLETISGSSSNCVDTGVTVTNEVVLFDLAGAAGTITAKISTDNGVTFSSPVTSAITVPSANLFPKFLITTRTTAARALYIDRWELLITGLTRP